MIIRQIGDRFDDGVAEQKSYFSDDYILEADILVIDLEAVYSEIEEVEKWDAIKGVNVINQATYADILKTVKERQEQINNYLDRGDNLYVFFSDKMTYDLNIRSEKKGIEEVFFDLLSVIGLSSYDFKIKKQKGNILDCKEEVKNIFSSYTVSYEFYFLMHPGTSLANVTKTKHPVSLQIPAKNGYIFILPSLTTPAEYTEEYVSKQYKAFLALADFDKSIKGKKDMLSINSAPQWAEDFSFGNELKEKEILAQLLQKKAKVEDEITLQLQTIQKFNDIKKILYANGPELEQVISTLLEKIGFQFEEPGHNRDDLILLYKNNILVVEIKGVKGSAAESHAAQLLKWVNNYHLSKGINPKGILIINAYKDKPLDKRTEQSFPNQMLPYSIQMGFCLLTTTQLLELYLDFEDKKIDLKEIAKLLLETVGILEYSSFNKIKGNI